VLFDTTSLMFAGRGGESLDRLGVSKDHRPDLHQVVVGVVLDEAGRPLCSETWPGNATDVKSLMPIVTRLRDRFGIRRMGVVADRGMISAQTIAELEAGGIDYILGARERSSSEIREVVLTDHAPMVPLTMPRARGSEVDIQVKEVIAGDWGPGAKPRRYVICFNPVEARRDAAVRETVVASLRGKLKAGDKELVGNAGYRRFLATPQEGHFEIDAARVAEDAQFDGLHVLRTNSTMNMLSVALAYRELWRVEAIFRTAKSTLESRPIFHQSDAAITGHLFCSFLALLLRKELDERLAAAGVNAEWSDLVRDLDRVEQVTIEQAAKRFVLRPQAPGCAGAVFKAVGVALPPLVQQIPTGPPPAKLPPPPPHRGRPRCGATSP
jgi:Transposase DDE domain